MGKRYMKCTFIDEDKHLYYFELDHEGTVYRQITMINDDKTFASNRPFKDVHFCLSEKPIDFIPEKEVSKEEFERNWLKENEINIQEWYKTKNKFPIGTTVEGIIECIYPQGIIINCQDNIYGVVDYDKCCETSGSNKIYVRNRVRGNVKGFDEANLWVVIEDGEVILDVHSKK